jgi:hypothetical protein
MKNRIVKYSLFALVLIFIGIQFIRPERNLGKADGPNDLTHFVPVPADVKQILQKSCYDCHSNHTNYPWYVNVNPVAMLMRKHIVQGKEDLNFSDLSGMSKRRLSHKLSSIADQVQNHEMPIASYTLIHYKAKLNDKEIKIIKNWTDMASQHITIKTN